MSFFRKLLLVLFAGFIANGFSQNLIPNASFENIDYCDNLQNLFPLCTPWLNPSITPSFPTPNVFNECAEIFQDGFGIPVNIAGYQYARTGKGYGGIVTYSDYEEGRDYISVKLFNTLDANRTYCIEYYVSLPNYDTTVQPNGGSRYAIDCMGAFLSDTIFHQYNGDTITAIPQIINTPGYFLMDTINWMIISGTYIAHGGEQYITIGNFKSNASTNFVQVSNSHSHGTFYYIDDVSVYDCDTPVYEAESGNNTTICRGDSVQIGAASHSQYLYSWSPSINISDTTIANPWAKPTVTTTYHLKQKDFKFEETTDSITITVKECPPQTFFNVYPSLATDQIYIDYSNLAINNTHFMLYDVCGRKVKEIEITKPTALQSLDIKRFSAGMYFYRLVINGDEKYRGKIVVKK